MPDPTPPPVAAPLRRRNLGGCLFPLVLLLLFVSLLVNIFVGVYHAGDLISGAEPADRLDERFLLGDRHAADVVAVVRMEGVITDSSIAFPIAQLKRAARDKHVKAVVLRIDSPGGTVTASEELYQCVVNLRDDTGRRFAGTGPKPVRVSMGGLAASGGYFIAVAGNPIAAEPTTITGSIGVFAMLPNAAEFARTHGIRVELVKAGPIKAAGSFFHTLGPEERQTWQDTVDNAYNLFLDRIAVGRRTSREKLRDDVAIRGTTVVRDEKGNAKKNDKGEDQTVRYTRTRADGGTFTAAQAQELGLIDVVEDLPAVIRSAAAGAGLTRFRAVMYDRPPGLVDYLLPQTRQTQADPLTRIARALTPRLWFLIPSADGALLTVDP